MADASPPSLEGMSAAEVAQSREQARQMREQVDALPAGFVRQQVDRAHSHHTRRIPLSRASVTAGVRPHRPPDPSRHITLRARRRQTRPLKTQPFSASSEHRAVDDPSSP